MLIILTTAPKTIASRRASSYNRKHTKKQVKT